MLLPFFRGSVWWWMSESEKMTNHTHGILSMDDKSFCVLTSSSLSLAGAIVLSAPHIGRQAFVMSLSSHFSIQIQNNCVIMNVDTNQHRRSLSAVSRALIVDPFSTHRILRHEFMHASLSFPFNPPLLCAPSCVHARMCLCFAWIIEFHIVLCCVAESGFIYLRDWINLLSSKSSCARSHAHRHNYNKRRMNICQNEWCRSA